MGASVDRPSLFRPSTTLSRLRERGECWTTPKPCVATRLKPNNGCGLTCRRGAVPAGEALALCLKAWRRGGVGMIDNMVMYC